jgi:hypothetical protein
MLSKNDHVRCEPGKGIVHKMIFSLTTRWSRPGYLERLGGYLSLPVN